MSENKQPRRGDDVKLTALFENLPKMLGDLARLRLRTHGTLRESGEFVSCALWNGDEGQRGFYWLAGRPTSEQWKLPKGFVSDQPIVDCTLLDALEMAWRTQSMLVIDGIRIWDASFLKVHFMAILYDVRGYETASTEAADAAQRFVFEDLSVAADVLLRVCTARKVELPSAAAGGAIHAG